MNEDNNRKITENLKKLGYVYVTVDLQGFRSGSMNDQLIKNTNKEIDQLKIDMYKSKKIELLLFDRTNQKLQKLYKLS